MALNTPRKKASLADNVVETLTRQIRNGEYAPGDRLPTESKIMQSLGVSRTVVREALSRLQAAGAVETRHGIGTFVLPPESERGLGLNHPDLLTMLDVLAVLDVRISLETEAAGLAALQRTDAHLTAMRTALDAFNAAIVADQNAVEADIAFHLQIAQATGNRYFVQLLTQLGSAIIPRTRVNSARYAARNRSSYLDSVNREHEGILDAIRRQDPEAARAAMREHLTNSRERLRRASEIAPVQTD
ncbi:FadR/GntR family transcriptional regulator [Lysobacter sp. CA199]|uniref:FadR/GntR family transcriptional regulator n=1 Tax=Lysobacter sp. CA199 TaxID=3455608 RepID=UPI003F8D6E84